MFLPSSVYCIKDETDFATHKTEGQIRAKKTKKGRKRPKKRKDQGHFFRIDANMYCLKNNVHVFEFIWSKYFHFRNPCQIWRIGKMQLFHFCYQQFSQNWCLLQSSCFFLRFYSTLCYNDVANHTTLQRQRLSSQVALGGGGCFTHFSHPSIHPRLSHMMRQNEYEKHSEIRGDRWGQLL
jgi:hypothetical protein